MKRAFLVLLPLLSAAAALAAPLESVSSLGDVSLTVRAGDDTVSPLDTIDVSIELTAPDGLQVALPADFSDRLDGLTLLGSFEEEPLVAAGVRRRVVRLHLRPVVGAPRLRLAPFAVRFPDASAPAKEAWFPSKPLVFKPAPALPPGEKAPSDVEDGLKPLWIPPTGREILRWALLSVSGLLAAAMLVLLVRWILRRIKLARMAPRERALFELKSLLARHLVARGRFKEFYVELTHVVRRYIERRHGIRAPEQTTEEFLQEAARSGSFTPETLARLRDFLSSADLVKFAGVDASESTAESAAASARAYLESEPAAPKPSEKPALASTADVR